MKSTNIDFRREAEERALKIKRDKLDQERAIAAVQAEAATPLRSKELFVDASARDDVTNTTPCDARLAEVDYHLNGSRARSDTGEFIPPRWIPDQETANCFKCNSGFDWVSRRHHCRHCGRVFCSDCSTGRALLPIAFGERDPQRVCDECEAVLRPYQLQLTHTIANHQRANTIDDIEGACSRRYFNLPYSGTLGSEIRKAAYSTHNLFTLDWIKDKTIPLQLLQHARGLAFLTVGKVGLGFAVRLGTGLVVARLPDGSWSAPTAIASAGCTWGFLAGADVTDYVIILTTADAVEAFSGSGQLSIGAGIDVAVGPLGREISGSFNIGTEGFAPAYSYSHSRGIYAGVGLEGTLILARSSVNFNFYGRDLSPKEILSGAVPAPRAAQPLYDALYHASGDVPNATYTPAYSMTGGTDPQERRSASGYTKVSTKTTTTTSAASAASASTEWYREAGAQGSGGSNMSVQMQLRSPQNPVAAATAWGQGSASAPVPSGAASQEAFYSGEAGAGTGAKGAIPRRYPAPAAVTAMSGGMF
jgi:lipid-binding SYLF domain-containing protein/5-methylcytosine-specific restriction endonuclease McrA